MSANFSIFKLFAPNIPNPIAAFYPGSFATIHGAPNSTPATLRISNLADHIRTDVILSLLLIEKARRFGGGKRFMGFGTLSVWHSAALLNFSQVGAGSYR